MRESIHPIDRVLTEYGLDSQTLALALRVSVEAVRTWRRGTRRITPDAARITEARFGVPKHLLRPDLWDAPAEPKSSRRNQKENALTPNLRG